MMASLLLLLLPGVVLFPSSCTQVPDRWCCRQSSSSMPYPTPAWGLWEASWGELCSSQGLLLLGLGLGPGLGVVEGPWWLLLLPG